MSSQNNPRYYTGRFKHYPDGSWELMTASCAIWSEEPQSRASCASKPEPIDMKLLFELGMIDAPEEGGLAWTYDDDGERIVSASKRAENLKRAMRRARTKVRDIALCTPFKYFVTLTLDKAKVDRYDMDEITKLLNKWLSNQVRNHGLSYVLVPERHKDGAIHFHGFFNDALTVIDSRHKDSKGHTIYNLPAWSLGFTTAIELYGDYASAVSYVCKYVGKQCQPGGWHDGSRCEPSSKIGGRWYYSGGQLGTPVVEYCDATNEDAQAMENAYSFHIEAAALDCVIVRGQKEITPNGDKTDQSSIHAASELQYGDPQGLPLVACMQNAEMLEMSGLQNASRGGGEKADLTFFGLSSPHANPCPTSTLRDNCQNMTP